MFACVAKEYGIDPFELRQRWTWGQFWLALDCFEYRLHLTDWMEATAEDRRADSAGGAKESSTSSLMDFIKEAKARGMVKTHYVRKN